jgi:glutathione S-transferase
MQLLTNGMSPYGRKVMIVMHELDLSDRVTLVGAQPRERPDQVVRHNPLGKIPVLITDSGQTIVDSPVICEFLDAEYGGNRLVPASGAKRWEVLATVASADGIIEAAVLVRNERLRPAEQQSAGFIDWHAQKVRRSLDAFEGRAAGLLRTFDLGVIALGCALSYVPRRLQEFEALKGWPRLGAFAAELSQRPSFAATAPSN